MGKATSMDWAIILLIGLIILVITNGVLHHKAISKRPVVEVPVDERALSQRVTLNNKIIALEKKVDKVPSKVLESITSSANNYKGNLGELIGYMQLTAKYDKLVAWGNVTDFIGIKWATTGDPGTIDFIDIKNGPHAKLTRDQSRLKKIIDEGKIKFIKVRIDTEV